MVVSHAGARLEELAQNLFALITRFSLVVPRMRRRASNLKEVEYLTLAILQQHESRIVGDLQRLLGVLPAQMSRIIRSLEGRVPPLITCRINPQDKRKIDVCLTAAGEDALLDYQAQHLRTLAELLRTLSEDEQEELVHLLDKLQAQIDRS
jgi:DNA-binding MarR family transcriptional regulator